MAVNGAICLFLLIGAIEAHSVGAHGVRTAIGKTEMIMTKLSSPGKTNSYSIPDTVPDSACTVVIFASVRCGNTNPVVQDIAIYTSGHPEHKQYLAVQKLPSASL